MKIKNYIYLASLLLIVVIAFIAIPTAVVADPPPPVPPPVGTPIDGGVLILAVAGLIYGVKKFF